MPHLKINRKLEPLLRKSKPIKIAIGGRASGKSIGFGDIFTMKMATERADVYCLREYQDTVSDSVHRVFKESIEHRLNLKGWGIFENRIVSPGGACTTYKGANRNPDSMQSAQNYKYSWFEEAHRASQASLDKLLPTIIRNPGSECWFSANPQSANDPFSQRFLVPYQDAINRDGFYEDELHLIVVVNWRDNPWFTEESERLRQWDYKHRSRAMYDWIWEGKYLDEVENTIVQAEWFDACIDAHKKLGFCVDYQGNTEPTGAKVAGLDPADVGKDAHGYVERHGVIIQRLEEIAAPNANRAFDVASMKAKNYGALSFGWDGDGLGAVLRDQAEKNFAEIDINIYMYRGSSEVHDPTDLFKAESAAIDMKSERMNKEVFLNKKAQNTVGYAERIFRTWESVEHGKYHDPDTLISFDSETIEPAMLQKMRAESCKLPLKPGDKIKFYTKDELRKGVLMPNGQRVVIPSPNLLDATVLSFDKDAFIFGNQQASELQFASLY